MEQNKLLTECERRRKRLWERIVNRYRMYREELPDITSNRAMGIVAREEGLTLQGVRYILIRTGNYIPKMKG